MTDTRNYNLIISYYPYQRPDFIFSGSEADLKDFINRNKTTRTVAVISGKEVTKTTVAEYDLSDLKVTIDGPDVESYFD